MRWLFLLLFPCTLFGQGTYNAASCSQADVQAAFNAEIASSVDGDVIAIPVGSCIWTGSTIVNGNFTHNVTIRGAGAIYPTNADTGGTSTTGTDQTVIFDEVTHSGGAASCCSWNITQVAGKSLRLTGIALKEDGNSQAPNNGMLDISGPSTAVRMDHCHFVMTISASTIQTDTVYGVFDHNYFEGQQTGAAPGGVKVFNSGTDTVAQGDQVWNQGDQWGSANFLFIEANLFNAHSFGDSHNGGRYVFRYNTFTTNYQTAPQMANHGVTNSRGRGMRAAEMYHNFISNLFVSVGNSHGNNQPTTSPNSGTLLYWGNTVNFYTKAVEIGYTCRMNQTSCSYSYPAPPAEWGNCGGPNAGAPNGPSNWDQNADSSGYACFDQPGRGQGDYLNGIFPNVCNKTLNPACNIFTGQWPRQALSPIYVWNVAFTPATGYSSHPLVGNDIAQYNLVADNRDYFQQFGTNAEPGTFNGTAGVGTGTLDPTNASAYTGAPNCSNATYPGPGYWNSQTQHLWVCTALNTWTDYYTPFTYPHPLTGVQWVPNTNGRDYTNGGANGRSYSNGINGANGRKYP